MNSISIRAKRLTSILNFPGLAYATDGSSGLDLYAATTEPVSLRGGGKAAIPVGFAVEIPEGYEGQIRGRSGLAKNENIGVTQGIGTIDSDYRGELVVLLSHHGHLTDHKWIMPGEKIAQLVIVPVMRAAVTEVDALSDTDRGTAGFGSTGNGLAPDAPQTPAAPAADPVVAETPAPVVADAAGDAGKADAGAAADAASTGADAQSQSSQTSQDQPASDAGNAANGGEQSAAAQDSAQQSSAGADAAASQGAADAEKAGAPEAV